MTSIHVEEGGRARMAHGFRTVPLLAVAFVVGMLLFFDCFHQNSTEVQLRSTPSPLLVSDGGLPQSLGMDLTDAEIEQVDCDGGHSAVPWAYSV